jgi:peptidoglycan/xylan/chitin deacetylase (PgdA/CDA1 family)
MAEKYCKNHPQTPASNRCFQCKDFICSHCRLTLAHHYFCSYTCYLKYSLQLFAKKIKPYQFRILAASQIFLLAGLFLLFFYIHQRFQNFTENAVPPATGDSIYFANLRTVLKSKGHDIENPVSNQPGQTMENHYTFEIPLQKNYIVNVWRNDQPVISQWGQQDGLATFTLPLDYGKNQLRILVLDQQQQIVQQEQIRIDYRSQTVELLRRSLERGDPSKKIIALTFDGGSDDNHTREILAILKEHDLKCTLFLTGKFMERYPDLVKEMIIQGHEIGNHTYNHPHLTTYTEDYRQQLRSGITREFVQKQLLKTDSVFFAITGSKLQPYWRAPFGEYNDQILTWAAEIGYLHIHWTGSFDTHDWVTDESSDLYHTPEEIFTQVMKFETENSAGLNGVIILMHLGSQRLENHIFEILPQLIKEVQAKGYTFSIISGLLD